MSTTVKPLNEVLRPVSAMLRECLVNANKEIAELDLTRLKLYIPQLSVHDDSIYQARVLAYNPNTTVYRLDSNQTFTYSRVEADTALTLYGITERVFKKSQYAELESLLSGVGEFVVTEGDLSSPAGNATVVFYFGEQPDKQTGLRPAYYIPLLPDNVVKAHYSIPFKGVVTFTFTGTAEVTEQPEVPVVNPDDANKIDLNAIFINRNLGNVTAASYR